MSLRKQMRQLMLAAGLVAGTMSVQAALVDGSGQITDWGFTPFNNTNTFGNWGNGSPPGPSGVGAIQTGQTSVNSWAEGNNAAPVDYPGPGTNVPSPSGVAGERFDNEFLGWRLNAGGTQMQILAVTSLNPSTGVTYNGRTWHLGDVFIDADGNSATGYNGYDFALTSGQWTSLNNDPLHPNDNGSGSGVHTYDHTMAQGLYDINGVNDVHGASDTGGEGGNPALDPSLNPVSVRSGATQIANSGFGLQTDTFNYGNVFGSNENGTWILEWTVDISALAGFNPFAASLHLAQECGNDFLNAGPLLPPDNDQPPVPEPATLGLIGLGLASVGALRRRKQAKA